MIDSRENAAASPIDPALFRDLVAEARLAPSVHNIQPTRWRLQADGSIVLIDDLTRRIPAADPTGRDVMISHGAALEGMNLALNRRGLSIAEVGMVRNAVAPNLAALCRFTTAPATALDPLAEIALRRMSWRGMFHRDDEDRERLDVLAATRSDIVCVSERTAVADIAAWADEADMVVLRHEDCRRELLDWMRLSRRSPAYDHNGLNRDALAMSGIEAIGARVVLGTLFPWFDRFGLAAGLASDRRKTLSAAAIVLFHRPRDEDALETGRHFYRAWLEIERAGFSACPMSSLADHAAINARLAKRAGIDDARRLVNVFRIGRPARARAVRHFREPVDSLIV